MHTYASFINAKWVQLTHKSPCRNSFIPMKSESFVSLLCGVQNLQIKLYSAQTPVISLKCYSFVPLVLTPSLRFSLPQGRKQQEIAVDYLFEEELGLKIYGETHMFECGKEREGHVRTTVC